MGAALATAFALRNRSWLYAPLRDHAWNAALIGILVAGIAGSLTNDSGPILFVASVFLLTCITAYIQGSPALAPDDGPERAHAHADVPAGSSTLDDPAAASARSAARVS